MNIINVSNLSVSFKGKKVFENLSFNVKQGDYLCVVGENGSGKTTLMRCLLGLVPKTSGKIEYIGIGKNSIGWLPQRSEVKRDFPASVYEIVLSSFSAKGFFGLFYTKKQKEKAKENMQILGIDGMKNRPFSLLSGGQQQRVLLCRALCAADSVLLLDEPISGLDSAACDELYAAARELNERGITIIMISHDVHTATREAKNILHIAKGEYFFGTSEEYKSSHLFECRKGV